MWIQHCCCTVNMPELSRWGHEETRFPNLTGPVVVPIFPWRNWPNILHMSCGAPSVNTYSNESATFQEAADITSPGLDCTSSWGFVQLFNKNIQTKKNRWTTSPNLWTIIVSGKKMHSRLFSYSLRRCVCTLCANDLHFCNAPVTPEDTNTFFLLAFLWDQPECEVTVNNNNNSNNNKNSVD